MYRVKQFIWAITAGFRPIDYGIINKYLTKKEKKLFFKMLNYFTKTFHVLQHFFIFCWKLNSKTTLYQLTFSLQPTSYLLERRWSSRTFRYGYLVTTSPQLSIPPSAAPSFRLGHWLRVLPTPMVWRAVCTRPGNVFTATFWFAITSDSSFM